MTKENAGGGMWYDRMRRSAQHNLSEYDPVNLDIDEWVDYWVSLELDVLILTAGGFIAMYPTDLPHHYRSQFLGDRDLLGDYAGALKRKGIRVVARIETNWAHQQILDERPDWFERDADGQPVHHPETPWVYHICMFSSFHTEQVPAIMTEISSKYDVDGFFTNSWPPSERPYRCYCERCQEAGDQTPRALYERSRSRIIDVCELLNRVSREGKPDCVYNINIGGGIRAAQSHMQLGRIGAWLTADHQGRTGDTPIWDVTQQGRVARAIMGTRPLTNVVGTKSGIWRHSTKSRAELEMWLAGCVASGMIPWYVWLGSEVRDTRWQEIGRTFYQWLAKHEPHFSNKDSVANVAVLFSQKANAFYPAPERTNFGYGARGDRPGASGTPTHHLQGCYYALLKSRIAFDFVHEEDLGSGSLSKYSVLVLPNSAVLSDEQCAQLRAYVAGGGSVVATFETSLYDEWGEPRRDFGLSDVLGVHKAQGRAREGRTFYTMVNGPHEILDGLENTDWLPGGEYRVPIEQAEGAILTAVPPYPQGIPEMVYPYARMELEYLGTDSSEPSLVAREIGAARIVYFSGDIGRCLWLYGNTDLSRLLGNAVRWALRGETPVSVTGGGVIEFFAWRTSAGYAVHLLNYTNPNMTHADIEHTYPLGEQQVRIVVDESEEIGHVELLRAGGDIPFTRERSTVRFAIPRLDDYEVAVLHLR